MTIAIWIIIVCAIAALIYRQIRPRAPERLYGQTMDRSPTKPVQASPPEPVVDNASANQPEPSDEPEHYISPGARVAFICFLSLWLIGWSFAVYFAFLDWWAMSYGDDDFIFFCVWLAIAIPGWFFVAYTLIRLFRGDHFEIYFDGDD